MADISSSPVTTVIKAIPSSVAVQFIFEPFYELYQCFQDATTKKHLQTRNIVQGLIVLLALVTGGIILPFSSPVYFDFATRLAPILNATDQANSFFSYYFSAWFIAYPLSWISRSFINVYSLCKYGDLEFYLTKDRKKILFEALDESETQIEEIFLYVRSQLRSGKSIPGARQEDLIEVLLAFMSGAANEVIRVYENQKKFYMAYLWESGQTTDILNEQNITRFTKKYNVSANEVTAVLEHCILGIRLNSSTIGSRKEDYISIIQNILDANTLGYKSFKEQRYHLENIKLLQDLTDLIYIRKTQTRTDSGSFTSRPGEIDLEEGKRTHDLEVWALEFAKKNWKQIANDDNVPTSLSIEVLEQLVAYFSEALKPVNLEYPRTLSTKNSALLFQAGNLPTKNLKQAADATKSIDSNNEEESKHQNSPSRPRNKSLTSEN